MSRLEDKVLQKKTIINHKKGFESTASANYNVVVHVETIREYNLQTKICKKHVP
jgi:hypothetical protein